MRTAMTVRPGNAPQPPHDHRVIQSFDEISADVGRTFRSAAGERRV
jgi:hypothetical protein